MLRFETNIARAGILETMPVCERYYVEDETILTLLIDF
jgi:hypothetical protein